MPDCQPPSARLNALSLQKNIPVSITIELTRRCPLSCKHCYLPETRGRARPGRELQTEEWKNILGQMARAGGLYLVFTGGEPLLRPDLAELCWHARKLNFDVRVFSTGLGLTPELASELAAAGVSGFEVSLYGAPAVHDGITGLKGSLARSLSAARLLKNNGISVKIKAPLMDINFKEAGRLEKLAKREGFGISFDPVIAPANDGDKSALPLRLTGRRLASAIKRFGGQPPGAEMSAVPGKAPLPPFPAGFICGAGRNVCALDPAGNLYPCLQLPVKLGNLTRLPFKSVWKRSVWLKKWRKASVKDLKGCVFCPDRDYCSLCPGLSLLEEGDIFAPNKPACEIAAITRKVAGPGSMNKPEKRFLRLF